MIEQIKSVLLLTIIFIDPVLNGRFTCVYDQFYFHYA